MTQITFEKDKKDIDFISVSTVIRRRKKYGLDV